MTNNMDCDYLVVGGGATGMAFVDTLLKHSLSSDGSGSESEDSSSSVPVVVMVDNHVTPGGQWHDSYKFVQLHQPSSMYGVETMKLEPSEDKEEDVADASTTTTTTTSHSHCHRATRLEILNYYEKVQKKLSQKYNFQFMGNMYCDLDNITTTTTTNTSEDDDVDVDGVSVSISKVSLIPAASKTKTTGTTTATTTTNNNSMIITMNVRKRIVDARYLEPDLPIFVKPKFIFDGKYVNCVPVNTLFENENENKVEDEDEDEVNVAVAEARIEEKYVIIGAGKTGMDAITYLLTQKHVPPDNIMWIVPNEAWITARENIGSCMEFLHTCTEILKKRAKQQQQQQQQQSTTTMKDVLETTPDLLQQGFLEWEKLGKVYRFDKAKLPTKFKDATLCQQEMNTILSVKRNNIVNGYGRITKIGNSGEMYFVNNNNNNNNNNNKNNNADEKTVVVKNLPDGWTINNTIFIHCSAGAFHYTKQQQQKQKATPLPFNNNLITIQDVYGTPGFCFVGSIFGFLEAIKNPKLSDQQKNDLLRAPQKSESESESESKTNNDDTTKEEVPVVVDLGPSGGDIDNLLSINHGLVQRFDNLRKWLEIDEMKTWLIGHRLFNLGHRTSQEIDKMVDEISFVLKDCGIIID